MGRYWKRMRGRRGSRRVALGYQLLVLREPADSASRRDTNNFDDRHRSSGIEDTTLVEIVTRRGPFCGDARPLRARRSPLPRSRWSS